MILYDSPISGNAYKARLLFAQLGIDYERRDVDVVDRKNPRDELTALNPARGVPTVVLDDGRVLAESNAILWYFAEGTSLLPGDPFERAQVLQWLLFEQDQIGPLSVARFLIGYSGWPREQYEPRLKEFWSRSRKALTALDTALARREWVVGEAPTIADLALYAYVHCADEAEFDLEPYAEVRRWLANVAAMPGHVTMTA